MLKLLCWPHQQAGLGFPLTHVPDQMWHHTMSISSCTLLAEISSHPTGVRRLGWIHRHWAAMSCLLGFNAVSGNGGPCTHIRRLNTHGTGVRSSYHTCPISLVGNQGIKNCRSINRQLRHLIHMKGAPWVPVPASVEGKTCTSTTHLLWEAPMGGAERCPDPPS